MFYNSEYFFRVDRHRKGRVIRLVDNEENRDCLESEYIM